MSAIPSAGETGESLDMRQATVEDSCANGSGTPNICEIVVIRHGQTSYNKVHRLQGQLDIPLNDEGRSQCKKCGAEVKAMLSSSPSSGPALAAVYSSPLGRARESADIICKEANISSDLIIEDPRIMEWNAGVLQGHYLKDIEHDFPLEWKKWRVARDLDFVVEGGESLKMRYTRVREFFLEKATLHMGQRILVVTHGGVMDDLLRLARNLPMDANTRAPKLNAEINILHAIEKPEKRPLANLGNETSPEVNPLQWEIISWGTLGAKSEIPKDWPSSYTEYV